MSESTIRNKIRQQIKPLPKGRLFSTGWAGKLTFEQIAEEVSPKVSWKYKQYGLCDQDIPDSIQNGLMKLWEQLLETPALLAETNFMGAVWRIIAGSNSNWYLRYDRRYKTYSECLNLVVSLDRVGRIISKTVKKRYDPISICRGFLPKF